MAQLTESVQKCIYFAIRTVKGCWPKPNSHNYLSRLPHFTNMQVDTYYLWQHSLYTIIVTPEDKLPSVNKFVLQKNYSNIFGK